MSKYEENPFSDPFADPGASDAAPVTHPSTLDDYNPFADQNQPKSQPAVMEPSGSPPAYTPSPVTTPNPQPTPQQQAIPGHEELLRRQAELERKAEELAKKEQELNAGTYNPRANNWPPIPAWCPVGPCFFQDFALDIPAHSQRTIKLLYYCWMYYVILMFLNVLVCLAIFIADKTQGVMFGMAILWFCINSPCSICWYRPVYNAFRSDSSFWFFFFFFVMFIQVIVSLVQAIGIPGSGYAGWIAALSVVGLSSGVGILGFVMSSLFTVNTLVEVFLLKKVHSIYRASGASFEKAQQEFATGVMKNPGVQKAATQAATSALSGRN